MKVIRQLKGIKKDRIYCIKALDRAYYLFYIGMDNIGKRVYFYRISGANSILEVPIYLKEILRGKINSRNIYEFLYINEYEPVLDCIYDLYMTDLVISDKKIKNWYIKNRLINENIQNIEM